MLITFKSSASGDVIMFGDIAKQLLGIMGKNMGTRGIITVEQLPDAILMLRQAAAEDKTKPPATDAVDDDKDEEDTSPAGQRGAVSLAQRAVPLLELMEYSLKEKVPVTWGVG